jgi:hypothetical protein
VNRALVIALVVAAFTVAGGCGLGAGTSPGGVSLTVTRDFGARSVAPGVADVRAPGGETVMRFLQRRFHVGTRYGGRFVQSVNGIAGDSAAARPVDWFFYVNGIESSIGAADVKLHGGDRVWWDYHDWGSAMSVPAVVGSFPQPLRSGTGGKRLPVIVACADGGAPACAEVKRRLDAVGVIPAGGTVNTPSGEQSIRVLVGRWPQLRDDAVARRVERGPAVSGVYARFDAAGSRLKALAPTGATARALGAGSGLVAATRAHDEQPTWLVTGTDDAGVLAAAHSLRESDLVDHFALVLSGPGQGLPVPVISAAGGRP